MYDQQDLTDFIDLVFEYNNPPSLADIKEELGFSKAKINQIINLLMSYGIIDMDESAIVPLMDYNSAIMLVESIELE